MSIKNILLSLIFIFHINPILASQQPASSFVKTTADKQQSWYEWVKSFFVTPVKKSKFQTAVAQATATGKPLNLFEFYKQKEKKIDTKKREAIACDAANKFTVAIQNNTNVMKWLKNKPHNFLFGASSSSYQYEGGLDSDNANAIFYQKKGLEPAGKAISFLNSYEKDIKQMKDELGINCFRISIAWDRVQLAPELWNKPSETLWNQIAINHYKKIIKTLKNNNIEPIVVLHHYTIPQWFAEIGGFEKKENITYFVEFAKKMYEALHEDVTYWSTFNAIEGYAFKGYWTSDGPPGIHNMQITQTVMSNMLNAHVQIYQAIKSPEGLYRTNVNKNIPEPQIGIQKNIVLLDPHEESNICIRTATRPICILGTAMQNKGFFDFFTTGTFKMRIPSWINVSYTDLRAPQSIDWIGINEYSNMEMRGLTPQITTDETRKTENLNYRDYPEGIYRAVQIISDKIAKPLNIPIIITENGIATKNDEDGNKKRELFFRRTLYTIRKLIEEGYPIIGYTPWASHDNYEWPSQKQPDPYDRPYGMFHVNFDKNSPTYLQRTLKKGAEYYRDFVKAYFGAQK
jgi:beta-glucosidase